MQFKKTTACILVLGIYGQIFAFGDLRDTQRREIHAHALRPKGNSHDPNLRQGAIRTNLLGGVQNSKGTVKNNMGKELKPNTISFGDREWERDVKDEDEKDKDFSQDEDNTLDNDDKEEESFQSQDQTFDVDDDDFSDNDDDDRGDSDDDNDSRDDSESYDDGDDYNDNVAENDSDEDDFSDDKYDKNIYNAGFRRPKPKIQPLGQASHTMPRIAAKGMNRYG